MVTKFTPKTQGARDLWLLVILIVPLAIAGVIWGILGDFSSPRPEVTPTPITTPGTPSSTPAVFITFEQG